MSSSYSRPPHGAVVLPRPPFPAGQGSWGPLRSGDDPLAVGTHRNLLCDQSPCLTLSGQASREGLPGTGLGPEPIAGAWGPLPRAQRVMCTWAMWVREPQETWPLHTPRRATESARHPRVPGSPSQTQDSRQAGFPGGRGEAGRGRGLGLPRIPAGARQTGARANPQFPIPPPRVRPPTPHGTRHQGPAFGRSSHTQHRRSDALSCCDSKGPCALTEDLTARTCTRAGPHVVTR